MAGGQELTAFAVVAASGSFGRPHRPALPGLDAFARPVLHVADYRSPASLPGEHVVVVGAGNSAVQVAYELAAERRVTLAGRAPIRFVEQRPLGRDLHFWFRVTGFDRLPLARADAPPAAPVLDDGRYRRALRERRYVRRAMFTRLDGDQVVWSDGRRERVDAVLLATGYRPDLPYLAETGALARTGARASAVACRSPIPASATWAWSGSVRPPPTPCAGSAPPPATSSPHSSATCA
ncbi:NAD(P)-binding domain-containing protein [Nonomuraea sp. NPDC048892]|uniref:NAD(P)-binding domain-containing protein n=1 Tax=Nonomuraea sp. NPDC048892 TaxID=3154624 RepID=UPI0033E6928F